MTRVLGLAMLAAGAAAGYFGTRALLDRERLPEQLPAPLRPGLEKTRARLLRARRSAAEVLMEVERGRRAAERELMQDYLRRTGRLEDR